MRFRLLVIYLILMMGSGHVIFAQDDLFDLFDEDEQQEVDYTFATFKTTRVVIGHSIENPAPGVLLFLISHHFGRVNSGAYEFFGLDQATIRLGFEYGVTDRFSLGIGRSSYEKTFDGFLKYKILRQSSGMKKMPVTLTFFSSYALNSLKWEDPERTNYFSSRLAYTFQFLLARKLNDKFSVQLIPSLVHKNLVTTSEDQNDIFSLGIGGRYKLTQRISVNGEYHYVLPGQIVSSSYDNSLSFGFDIETGGHVFQLFLTNSNPMFERGFITETTGKWVNGDIFIGFNISRVFTIVKPKSFRE